MSWLLHIRDALMHQYAEYNSYTANNLSSESSASWLEKNENYTSDDYKKESIVNTDYNGDVPHD